MNHQAARSGKTIPLLTRSGIRFLVCGGAVPLAAALVNLEFAVSVVLLLLYLAYAGAVFTREIQWGIGIARSLRPALVLPERALSGTSTAVPLELVLGRAADEPLDCQVRLELPPQVKAVEAQLDLSLSAGGLVRSKELTITPLSRGVLVFNDFWVRFGRPGGRLCFQQRYQLESPAELKVLPNYRCGSERADPALISSNIGQRVLQEVYSEGREFDSLREYAVGDDLRRVDWKRSARSRSLVVKVYRPESHQRVMITVDCGRRMGNLVGDRFLLDYAADGASNLLHLVRRHDDEVGLFAFHHEVVSQIESRRTKSQEQLIVEELTNLRPGALEADYDLLTLWGRRIRRRCLFLLITSVSNPLGLEAVREALIPLVGKHLPLVVAIADRALVSLAEKPAEDLEDAYMIAAANQQLQGVESRVQWLRRSGIECVYADASKIGSVIAESYARLKLSGKL